MESLSISTGLPDGTRVFIFGSFSSGSDAPRDLDVLVVYDSDVVPPEDAFSVFAPLMEELGRKAGLPVDCTLLTVSEEAQVGFVASERCIEITPYDQETTR